MLIYVWFAMDLPTRFACMARLVAKITPDPWLIIKPALHDAPSALFPSDFGKYFANGWERRSANNSSSHFIELNVEAGKKLVNTAVFHSFLVVVAVVNRFLFLVAEIIATYLLVFVTCGSAALSASGLIVTVMIYCSWPHLWRTHEPCRHSGFRHCQTLPLGNSKLKAYLNALLQVPFYAAAQLTGAISAAFTLRVLLHPIKHLGTTSPSGTDIQALIMELVVTFSMMFIASAVATDTKAIGELAGIAVGSAVCITYILAGPVSGGSMNLARTIGPAIASGYYKGVWVYVLGPVCGTLQGAWSYNLIRVTNKPVQAILPASFSFKLRRMRSDNEQVTANDPLNVL
ncbi:hypothetical protein HYC85_003033 [Camellia sinensis]|uniref:Uncharacterized protein n=1 Tax=Camellia sinensis TaxID=4442 RepID=A0A7J7IBL9_CAMSI|nr:hypothetical protein HYC85_003033 [Camellia sinensis]